MRLAKFYKIKNAGCVMIRVKSTLSKQPVVIERIDQKRQYAWEEQKYSLKQDIGDRPGILLRSMSALLM